ncbi:MAG: hypothetical protein IJC07_02895 [Clostridia bacterium]|nr:hypothetical protein [Clostridia bacterium]
MESIRERDLTWQIEEFKICCKRTNGRRDLKKHEKHNLKVVLYIANLISACYN